MYEISPIIKQEFIIEYPKCMYEVKNLNVAKNGYKGDTLTRAENSETFEQKHLDLPNMTELENKQKNILKQLEELKKLLNTVKGSLNLPKEKTIIKNNTKSNPKTQALRLNSEKLEDFVINASPNYPPYFLLFLQRLLKDELRIQISSHVHSSVNKLQPKSQYFINNLKEFKSQGQYTINVRLIWKEVGPDTEISVSYYPICGEVNILRYILRSINSSLYDNSVRADHFMDTSYLLSKISEKASRSSILQEISKSLKKSKWLMGTEATAADIALYSSIKNYVSSNEISADLAKWIKHSDDLIKSK